MSTKQFHVKQVNVLSVGLQFHVAIDYKKSEVYVSFLGLVETDRLKSAAKQLLSRNNFILYECYHVLSSWYYHV